MRVTIVGGGPVGCYTGYLLAKNGFKVSIFEEHKKVGLPIQCTGIVSKNLAKITNIDEDFIVNRVFGADIYSPNRSSLKIRKNTSQAFILDRERFDNHWLEQAKDTGCKIHFNQYYINFKDNTAFFKNNKTQTDILVGADGPLSTVAKTNNLFHNRKFLHGIQTTIKDTKFNQKNIEMHLGSICPGFFAWKVPEGNNKIRIGLASEQNAKTHFQNFLKSQNTKPNKIQSGLIPVYNRKHKIQNKNVYLVGDAACHVKSTTGGGIIMGFLAAKQLVKSLKTGKNYKKLVNKAIGTNLYTTHLIRRTLNNLKDNDYNHLIHLLNKPKAKTTLEQHGDMDFPTKFAVKLLLNQPKLLKFCSRIIA